MIHLEKFSSARIKNWHSLLFSSQAGIKPKNISEYRKGPVYISKANGRDPQIIYEALTADRIVSEFVKKGALTFQNSLLGVFTFSINE